AANCYGERVHNGWTRDIAAETANGLPLSERAFELGHDDGNILWMVAHAVLRLGKDLERAKELAYASLGWNPNSAIAMTIAGLTEVMSGNSEKALALLRRAQRLSPRDPRGWFTTSVLSLAYFTDGQFEEAAATAKKSLMQNPRLGAARRVLAASLATLGDRDRAADAVQQLLKIDPELSFPTLRARLSYMDQHVWDRYGGALRLAGMPE